MNLKQPLYSIPVASSGFVAEAYWDGEGPLPAIRFAYQMDGIEYHGGIEFRCVLAMRKRAERCCTTWHIEGACDTLVEVEDSSWVREIQLDTGEQWRNQFKTHHYMIYLDSAGCFEVIAASWTALQQKLNS